MSESPKEHPTENPKVPAADQTLQILKLLSSSRGPLAASMIASRLGLPRSTVYHLLATLQQHGFVMHLAEEKRYGLGIAAVELNSAYARQQPLSRLGDPLLRQLTDHLGLSTHLAVLHGSDVIYLVEERAPRSPSLVSDVDVRLPAALTATGRAILANLPKSQVRALFPNARAFTARPGLPLRVDRYSKLRSILDMTLTRGFSFEEEEITQGFSSVGVPVFDHRGWPVAGIAATFASADIAQPEWPGVAQSVQKTAAALSERLYGRTALRQQKTLG